MPAETTPDAPSSASDPPQRSVEERDQPARSGQQGSDFARYRDAAVAEIFGVINDSRADLARVFDVIVEKALACSGAAFGFLTSYDGERFTPVAMRGVPGPLAEYFGRGMDQPHPGEAHHRVLEGEDVIHNLDQKAEDAYRSGLPLRRAVVDLGGART